LEHSVGGLWDPARGNKSEPSVEGLFYDTLLFEHVRECPIRHLVNQTITLADGVRQPGTHVRGVRDLRLVLVAGVELTPDKGQLGQGRSLDLIMNLANGAADHLVARNFLVRAKDVLGLIVPINVAGNKIDRDVVLDAVTDEVISPGRLGGRRAANPQAWTYRLHHASRVIV